MALQKDIPQSTGVIPNYTRAMNPNINSTDDSGTVLVKIYLNAAARAANKSEVTNKMYSIPAGTFSSINMATTDPRDLVYTYLKTLAEYLGATDV